MRKRMNINNVSHKYFIAILLLLSTQIQEIFAQNQIGIENVKKEIRDSSFSLVDRINQKNKLNLTTKKLRIVFSDLGETEGMLKNDTVFLNFHTLENGNYFFTAIHEGLHNGHPEEIRKNQKILEKLNTKEWIINFKENLINHFIEQRSNERDRILQKREEAKTIKDFNFRNAKFEIHADQMPSHMDSTYDEEQIKHQAKYMTQKKEIYVRIKLILVYLTEIKKIKKSNINEKDIKELLDEPGYKDKGFLLLTKNHRTEVIEALKKIK